jgi:hypothetical protein
MGIKKVASVLEFCIFVYILVTKCKNVDKLRIWQHWKPCWNYGSLLSGLSNITVVLMKILVL